MTGTELEVDGRILLTIMW